MVNPAMPKLSTREKIVSAAFDRFHALGYTACGVQEIVDAAGVRKGSFYNYFKAKELLAVEVLRHLHARVRGRLLGRRNRRTQQLCSPVFRQPGRHADGAGHRATT
jgi:AcrR family transcriptional regulator